MHKKQKKSQNESFFEMMPNPEGISDLNKVFDFVIENTFFNKKRKFASIVCLGKLREATY